MVTMNLGRLDRILRFLLAFWWLGPLAPQFATPWINTVIAIFGWIALIESFWGFCWLQKVLGIDNRHQ